MRDTTDPDHPSPTLLSPLQRAILEAGLEKEPDFTRPSLPGFDPVEIKRECHYLAHHKLIELKQGSEQRNDPAYKILALGRDVLRGGGLSAALSVVNVRLDEQTMRALLVALAKEAPPTMRESVMKKIKESPANLVEGVTAQLAAALAAIMLGQ